MQNESSFNSCLLWQVLLILDLPSVIYLKKMRDQVDYLSADKHQSFLQGSANDFVGCGQACPK